MKRREFMRTAGGSAAAATAATAATGSAAAQEDGGGGGAEVQPVWPSGVEGANGGSYTDARGQDEVTISVGAGDGLSFDPTMVWIDPGTTVIWEWTGNGGDHNVETVEGPAEFESQITAEEGFTFEYETSEDDAGITHYQCGPHSQVGMHGGLAIGEDIETEEVGGANTGWPESVHDIGVPLHAHWVGLVSGVAITLTLAFTFYVLKYGESAHTGHGGSR